MRNLKRVLGVGVCSGLLWAFGAQAAELTEPSTGVSTTPPPVEAVAPSFKRISMSADSRFYGPALGNFSTLRPNLSTGRLDPKSALKTENKVSLYYRMDEDQAIGVSVEADIYPVSVDDGFLLKDPSLVYRRYNLSRGPIFYWDALARFYVPVGEVSQANNQVAAIRIEQTPKWSIPQSRFTIYSYAYISRLFYSDAKPGLKDWKFNWIPEIDYQLSPKLVAALAYKMWAYHVAGKSLTDMNNDVTYLSPGLIWKPTPQLTVNPYIDFSTGTKVTWDTTTLGVYLYVSLI